MAILVTGGAGYIGSHTCVELLNNGYDLVVLDNFCNSKPESLKRVKEITGRDFVTCRCDLLDREGVRGVFEQNSIDCVIHFAGLKAVGESCRLPLKYYQNNITGTLILCEEMERAGCKKIVFSSSATVYGTGKVPLREDAETGRGITNPYGRTKYMIEEILKDICIADKEWSVVLLRYFNPIGAHGSGKIGEDPNGIPNNLMPYITQVAVGKLPELSVFGDDYNTPDGTGVRDYIHVCDLAEGHVCAVKALGKTGAQVFNLGTGRGTSVLELVGAFEEASGRNIPYKVTPRRPGDLDELYADAGKAKAELGWSASRSVADMCRDSWRWQSQNPKGYVEE